MDSVIAPDAGVTQYFYNAVGNRDSLANPNGTSTGYRYDNLNRLVKVTNYGLSSTVISSYEYPLNDAGIRTAVEENDGSRVDYDYDDLYRLTGETRTGGSTGSPPGYSITYTYDNAGNRLALLEIKYKLPSRAGEVLNRLTSQIKTYETAAQQFAAQQAGVTARVIVFTFKEPTMKELELILNKLGPSANAIQFGHGLIGVAQWFRFFFQVGQGG